MPRACPGPTVRRSARPSMKYCSWWKPCAKRWSKWRRSWNWSSSPSARNSAMNGRLNRYFVPCASFNRMASGRIARNVRSVRIIRNVRNATHRRNATIAQNVRSATSRHNARIARIAKNGPPAQIGSTGKTGPSLPRPSPVATNRSRHVPNPSRSRPRSLTKFRNVWNNRNPPSRRSARKPGRWIEPGFLSRRGLEIVGGLPVCVFFQKAFALRQAGSLTQV